VAIRAESLPPQLKTFFEIYLNAVDMKIFERLLRKSNTYAAPQLRIETIERGGMLMQSPSYTSSGPGVQLTRETADEWFYKCSVELAHRFEYSKSN